MGFSGSSYNATRTVGDKRINVAKGKKGEQNTTECSNEKKKSRVCLNKEMLVTKLLHSKNLG